MKIKRLSIRNIASIEKADIDFEKDLNIKGTYEPSPIFLITGDTGSGKTVILDCISMALYGTTPRVKGVVNRNKNTFHTTDNKEISIADIAQYTRLGITWRDECYAKLTFEGNDGVTYTSCFSLGYTTQKNLRSPSWSLVGDNGISLEGSKKEEIRNTIVQAIGISYEQFCRMAMLAQGQFSNFLTGDKTEREKILEQLTSTEHFSLYGEAIERIFKRARQEKEICQKRLDEHRIGLLSIEEEESQVSLLKDMTESMTDIKKKQKKYEEILALWATLELRRTEIQENSDALVELKKEIESEEYSLMTLTLSRWDGSVRERDLLSRKLEAEKSLTAIAHSIEELFARYSILCSDLSYRRQELESLETGLKKLKEISDSKAAYHSIYQEVEIISERIRNFMELSDRLGKNKVQLSTSQDNSDKLKAKVNLAIKEVENTSAKYKSISEAIKRLMTALATLKPDELSEKIRNNTEEKALLENLIKSTQDITHILKEQEETSKLISQLSDDSQKLKKTVRHQKQKFESLTHEEEKAVTRYNTMHLSVEDNFNILRKHLGECVAEQCPLCGGKVNWAERTGSEEYNFKTILSPLENELSEIKDKVKQQQREIEESNRNMNIITGKLQATKDSAGSLKIKLEETVDKMDSLCAKLDISLSVNPDIDSECCNMVKEKAKALLIENEKESSTLSEHAKRIETLQLELQGLIQQSGNIEKLLRSKEKCLSDAKRDYDINCQKILQLTEAQNSLSEQLTSLHDLIDISISFYQPEWDKKSDEIIERLLKESGEYRHACDEIRDKETQVAAYIESLDRIDEMYSEIAECLRSYYPSGYEVCHANTASPVINEDSKRPYDLSGITRMWTRLFAELSSEMKKRESCRDIIKRNEALLKEYYTESDSTEEDLINILNMEMSIPSIRKRLLDSREILRSRSDALNKASKDAETISVRLAEISREEGTNYTESKDSASKAKEKSETELETIINETGNIRLRLEQNEKNKDRSIQLTKELEKAQERFAEWDRLNSYFGGTKFRTLVQSHILKPLLKNANLYLRKITDRFSLTCSDNNEQLSILVLDRYNKDTLRSATVLSGGERFMISLALSLALSALNKSDMNVDILFIDEGFGTLDTGSLTSVMDTLRKLPEIAGQNGRRVGIISHREELADQIDVRIKVQKCGEGRSRVVIE